VDDIFATVNALQKGAPSPPVEKPLDEPARFMYFVLTSASKSFEGETLVAWEALSHKLGDVENLPRKEKTHSIEKTHSQ
jgi:hypothetical protein